MADTAKDYCTMSMLSAFRVPMQRYHDVSKTTRVLCVKTLSLSKNISTEIAALQLLVRNTQDINTVLEELPSLGGVVDALKKATSVVHEANVSRAK